ncbi:hypothetical protein BK636_26850 [Pseudomonas chlororaphis]|uniref:hypothetical protein n=1 Tax=Pseudomonas chlororaphis TaxID=587753 RepID=UPI000F49B904|nr:hypothetical protein [Pseudomonas chlororaphis]ROL75848.1 hypothetical protein BK636_26850 [Pseudomonas chlororaphis]
MTRFAGFILLFVSLSGCAAQQVYNNQVYLANRCGQPLEIKVSNSSNMHALDRTMTSAAGSRVLVASFASYGEDVIEQIPANYLLTISDAAGSKTIDGAQLKRHLSGVEKISEGTQREWTIDDRTFCS